MAADQGRPAAVDAARRALQVARAEALASGRVPTLDGLARSAVEQAMRWAEPRPRHVINATGVIIHTNLGRAPLSTATLSAMAAAGAGYSDLEFDLDEGARGHRGAVLDALLTHVTGAPAAMVVNNNAGATLLVLAALAPGRGAVVSRGELVEIGGGFRLPEVFAAGGATLVEVGTTNRTYAADYAAALERAEPGQVGLMLRVHTSNYRLTGFVHRPELRELVELGRRSGVPVVDDLGSGSLLDTSRFGLSREPMVQESVAHGASLVTFSGDKLLGGPQAGIVVGEPELIARLRRHPLARALRPGRDVLAGLRTTLQHYARGEALEAIPVWRMIAATEAELAERARGWQADLVAGSDAAGGVAWSVVPGSSTVGGGSLPGETLPTALLAAEVADPDGLAAALRAAQPPIVGRIEARRLVLDPRTVLPGEDGALLAGLRQATTH